ncbi:unnamed protein product [Urochloa humidicola]
MDRLGDRKRAREEEETPAAGKKRGLQAEEDAAVVALFEEAADTAAALTAADGACGGGGEGAWVRPAGVFDLPWQKCRNGLGGGGGGGGWELRDVFFRSLVDGRAAAVGIPGDRLFSPPSKLTLFEDLEAWLAGAGDGEVDPLWRSVLEGPKPAA